MTIDPHKTALLMTDMQRDFMDPDGVYGRHGLAVGSLRRLIPPVARVAEASRAAGLPLFASKFTIWTSPAGAAIGIGHIVGARPFLAKEGFRRGDPGRELVAGLPRPDYHLDKPRFSAFHGTPLEPLLRSLGATTLVLTGIVTNGGVEATARDAILRDFGVVVLEDCVGALDDELHRGSLRNMGAYMTVASAAEYLEALK
ncbi:MAG: cysteine hydrolase [Candidatus Rokubacteria bacterium]|nr:cysteine hydrolase [Candidatus Rokubacteria bacterium]